MTDVTTMSTNTPETIMEDTDGRLCTQSDTQDRTHHTEGGSEYLFTDNTTYGGACAHTHSPSPALLLSLSSFERRPGDVDDEMRDER